MTARKPMEARSVRVSTALWQEAQQVAEVRGDLISEVIRAALVAYVKKDGEAARND